MDGFLVTNVIMAILLIVTSVYMAFWIFCLWQGDVKLGVHALHRDARIQKARTSSSTEVRKEIELVDISVVRSDLKSIVVKESLVIRNEGKQQGTIMDAFIRTHVPKEQIEGVTVEALMYRQDDVRADHYWQAYLLPSNEEIVIDVEITLTATELLLNDMVIDLPDIGMDLLCQVFGRSDWYYDKTRLVLSGDAVRRLMWAKGADE